MSHEKQVHLTTGTPTTNSKNNFYYGRVIDVNDPLDSYRIRVKLDGLDEKIDIATLPWCESFLPKFLSILPKEGEMVKVILFNPDTPFTKREWVGPVISQVQNLKFQSYQTALKNSDLSIQIPDKGFSKIPDSVEAYPDKKDIGLQGRDNTDILLKEKEILIRAGKFLVNDNVKTNTVNPSYIKLKITDDGLTSYSVTVANKIYLITHNAVTNFKTIIDDNTLKEIEKNADPAVLGNKWLEWAKLITEFCVTHVHTAAELPPNNGTGKVIEISKFDLPSVLSENVKLN
jgi:hypothetical protein